ncbi:MAG: hypothetical protein A2583_10820 [Bdellovibrionales bacterium RIFOXYD1_FULL_53_11]|nr:MAG: hypothetical protein A2583_10820 [Bdellovibrionales bacterium RIFOXYD1_FULL_53_11]
MLKLVSGFDDDFDRNKSQWTKKIRGIDFVEARMVFNDPNETIGPGTINNGEERWLCVGMANGKLWTVGYTIRRGLIRIFMIRPSHDDEREAYNG